MVRGQKRKTYWKGNVLRWRQKGHTQTQISTMHTYKSTLPSSPFSPCTECVCECVCVCVCVLECVCYPFACFCFALCPKWERWEWDAEKQTNVRDSISIWIIHMVANKIIKLDLFTTDKFSFIKDWRNMFISQNVKWLERVTMWIVDRYFVVPFHRRALQWGRKEWKTVKPHRGTHNSAEKRVRERNGVHSSSSSFLHVVCVCVCEWV